MRPANLERSPDVFWWSFGAASIRVQAEVRSSVEVEVRQGGVSFFNWFVFWRTKGNLVSLSLWIIVAMLWKFFLVSLVAESVVVLLNVENLVF